MTSGPLSPSSSVGRSATGISGTGYACGHIHPVTVSLSYSAVQTQLDWLPPRQVIVLPLSFSSMATWASPDLVNTTSQPDTARPRAIKVGSVRKLSAHSHLSVSVGPKGPLLPSGVQAARQKSVANPHQAISAEV